MSQSFMETSCGGRSAVILFLVGANTTRHSRRQAVGKPRRWVRDIPINLLDYMCNKCIIRLREPMVILFTAGLEGQSLLGK